MAVAGMAARGGPVEVAEATRAGRDIILTLGAGAVAGDLAWRKFKVRLETNALEPTP